MGLYLIAQINYNIHGNKVMNSLEVQKNKIIKLLVDTSFKFFKYGYGKKLNKKCIKIVLVNIASSIAKISYGENYELDASTDNIFVDYKFWNFVCDSKYGYDLVFNQIKESSIELS